MTQEIEFKVEDLVPEETWILSEDNSLDLVNKQGSIISSPIGQSGWLDLNNYDDKKELVDLLNFYHRHYQLQLSHALSVVALINKEILMLELLLTKSQIGISLMADILDDLFKLEEVPGLGSDADVVRVMNMRSRWKNLKEEREI